MMMDPAYEVEVVQIGRRKPRWRLRDEHGQVLNVAVGRVMLPKATPEENRRVRQAVDDVLKSRSAKG